MTHLRRFRRYLRPYLGTIALGLLFSVLVAISTAAVAALLKPMFNDVFYLGATPVPSAVDPGAIPGLAPGGALEAWKRRAVELATWLGRDVLGYDPERAYILVPLLFVVAFFVKGLFTYLSSYGLGVVGLRVVQDVRSDLNEAIQRQSLRFFSAHTTGALISRVTSDVAVLHEVVGVQLAEMIRLAFSMVFLIGAALIMDWRLSVICSVVLPLTIYPATRFSRKIKRSTTTSQSRLADLADRLQETIIGRRIVRSFNTEALEITRFRDLLGRMLQAERKAMKYRSLTTPVIELTGALAMGVLAGFAGWRIHAGSLDPGEFVATLAALYWIYAILKKFARYGNDLTRAEAAAERVFALLDQGADVIEKPGAASLPPFSREIRLCQASFAYGDEPVLDGVDVAIRKGEKVALVGASGAGKTTLANLVPRFYDVTGGSVAIDGFDVRDLTLASLRAQVGLVTQEVVLFNDTVRNNIAYGSRDVPPGRIEAAARAAHAHAFIEALPQGYDTQLGEAAQSLSAGQRQRIAIARALLKDAPILILDEATSALDAESERQVQDALEVLMRERTAIIIAHRLSTIRSADRILVLDHGRVIETGTHEELLRRNGAYARLHQIHFREVETAGGNTA